jgi:hypothetical protein
MVFCLSTHLNKAKRPMSIERGTPKHFKEIRLADVVRARAGYEDAAGAQHLQGAKIQFLVTAESSIEIALAFGEGGRVENDGVVVAIRGGIVFEQIEGVGLDPFNFFPI